MSFIPGANVGPYRIVEQAERNGVATTYTAYQPSLGRYVSVVVAPTIDRDDVALQRQYQRQIELVLSLRHPNVLTVLDHGVHMDVPFIVTELLEAEPLAERLGAPWPLVEVVRVLRPVATALDFAHGYGVVHGDVRPSAVVMTPDGTAILSGFGLSTRRFSEAEGQAAPEPGRRTPSISAEIAGAQAADRRGLALIAYEMLTGRTVDVETADFERPLPPAQLGSPLLTPPVERALLRELTGESENRYDDATSFIEDLAATLAPVRPPSAAPPPEPMPASAPSGGESRRQLITVAVILTVLAVLGSLALVLRGSEPTRPVAGPGATVPVAGSPGPSSAASGSAGVAATVVASSSPATTSAGSAAAAGTSASPTGAGAAPSTGASPRASTAGAAATATRPSSSIVLLVPTPDIVVPALPTSISSGTAGSPSATGPASSASKPGGGPASAAGAPAPKPATANTPSPVSTRIPVTWRVTGDPSGRWAFDEQGRVAGRAEEGASLLLFPESVEDVDFSALVNTASCQTTLVFRAQDDQNLLMVIYIPDGIPNPGSTGGGIWLYQRVEGLDLPIRAVRPATMSQAGQPARLKIVTSGPDIAVSLDGEVALQAVDTAPRAGRLGLMIYSSGGRECEATFAEIQR